jgi:hypothetical protein
MGGKKAQGMRETLFGIVVVFVVFTAVGAEAFDENKGLRLAALSAEVVKGRSVDSRTDGGRTGLYVTEGGYVAALEEDLLDEAMFWAGLGSEKDFERFLNSSPLVFPLKGGVRVYLEGYSYCGKVKIRPEGSQISVWTIREAIRTEIWQ